MNVIIPDWTAGKELPQWTGAYEAIEPSLRALLKAQISILHEFWLIREPEGGVISRLTDGGDCFESAPSLDWTIFLFAESYASPAGCIAAILPALMAGVGTVLISRLGGSETPLHPAISVALELLGREEVFAFSADDFRRLSVNFMEQNTHGLIIALGHELSGAYTVPARVRIGLEHGAGPDRNLLSWLHPGAEVETVAPGMFYDAVIAPSPEFYGTYPTSLVLGPGYEYFWSWPDLTPEFFRRKRLLLTRRLR